MCQWLPGARERGKDTVFIFEGDENDLELDSGIDCTQMQKCEKILHCILQKGYFYGVL